MEQLKADRFGDRMMGYLFCFFPSFGPMWSSFLGDWSCRRQDDNTTNMDLGELFIIACDSEICLSSEILGVFMCICWLFDNSVYGRKLVLAWVCVTKVC